MEDGGDLLGSSGAQQSASLGGGQLDHLHPPSHGQVAHLLHDREAAVGSGTDHQLWGRPWDLLIGGQRRVTEPVPIRLGGTLLPATSFPSLHYHVVVKSDSADHNLPEPGIFNIHPPTLRRSACKARLGVHCVLVCAQAATPNARAASASRRSRVHSGNPERRAEARR